jgi:ABC-type nitrate/sulfonate/bicarbonate transport systems, periplasmic components
MPYSCVDPPEETMPRHLRPATLAALLLLATPAARAEDLIPFRMGISAPSFTILPVHFADVGGFYAKNGLKVEIVNSEGGTRGLQVLLSGELQAMHVGLAPAVQANLKGADLRLVAATVNLMPFTVFATKATNPPLQKGATVAISTSARRPTSRSASCCNNSA